ncbi:ABC transporter permease [Gottschalkiaceae bacterium SANA]|nr:ABC transporter permease [Gottschalkiaceae bacterium SANA]
MDFLSLLEQGLIFGIMAIGILISFRILNFPDLTVDGSFATGAAVSASVLVNGGSAITAILAALAAGFVAGSVTGLIHAKGKVDGILAGILVMIGLYSINLRIMGKPNIPLFSVNHLFASKEGSLVKIIVITLLVKLMVDLFLKTHAGFVLRALGDNSRVVEGLGIDPGNYKIVGLGLANSLVAMSGAMMSQYQGFADISMGIGTLVTGLASIILGESLFKRFGFVAITTIALVGSFVYRVILATALHYGLEPSDLKLVTAFILLFILILEKKVGGKYARV